jgi:N-acetylmuramoyl-L-alanine amidase
VRIFRLGDRGPEIHDIQQRLVALGAHVDASELDGTFGSSTEAAVRAFQASRNLQVDGRVGDDTWAQLVEAGYRLGDRTLYLRSPLHRGDDVRTLQRKLNALGFDAGKQDGLFGPGTDHAVREFQRNVGQESDGIVGNDTLTLLERMRPTDSGPGRAVVREAEALRTMRSMSIEGQAVAIDRGPAPDPEVEASARSLIDALVEELSRLGAKPVRLDEDQARDTSARALMANEIGASLCLSVTLVSTDAGSTGPACSFFGSASTHSPAGMQLAQLILEELERAVGRAGRTHRLTASVLRETRMPAVQVEPLGQADDRSQLADPHFPVRVAAAIAGGVSRFFAD